MQITQLHINSSVALCALAVLTCGNFPAAASPSPPVKLNGTLRSGATVRDFAISPDNNWVVYRADQETNGVVELFVRPTAGGDSPFKLSQPLVQDGIVTDYAISPDGQQVVYLADAERHWVTELYCRRLTDRQQGPWKVNGPLPKIGLVYDFLVSRDSQWIVYSAVQDRTNIFDIYSRNLSGQGAPKRLNGDSTGSVALFNISPDSAWILYTADQDKAGVYELYRRPIDAGGTFSKLSGSMPDSGNVQQIRISPDSSRVIYLADQDKDEVMELYSAPIDGSTPPVKLNSPLQSGANVTKFAITPNSQWVVYLATTNDAGVFEIYSRPADGTGAPAKLNGRLSADGWVSSFAISQDSKWVVYAVANDQTDLWEMYSRPVDGTGSAIRLSDESATDGDVYQFWIAPDSQHVVCTVALPADGPLKLYTRPIDGNGTAVQLSKEGEGEVWKFTVTTNNHVLYVADDDEQGVRDIYFRSIDDTNAPVKLNGPLVTGGYVSAGALSHDDTWAVYLADQERTNVFELYSVQLGSSSDQPKLTAVGFSETGFVLSGETPAGLTYSLEVSDDLRTWIKVKSVGGKFDLTDEQTAASARRFYRLRLE